MGKLGFVNNSPYQFPSEIGIFKGSMNVKGVVNVFGDYDIAFAFGIPCSYVVFTEFTLHSISGGRAFSSNIFILLFS